jgi:hypothetical protein
MDANGYVGQQGPAATGTKLVLRQGALGDTIVSELHGRYYEQAKNQNMFWGANTAATAISVALATTYTGLCLSNPAGNMYNLVLTKVSWALSVAPAAIAPMGLITGFLAAGVVTHTTPLIAANCLIGTGRVATAKIDAAATLVGTPAWTMPLMGGFTAGALPGIPPAVLDFEGSIIIPPGAYAAIGSLTAVTGFGGFQWEEVPISA